MRREIETGGTAERGPVDGKPCVEDATRRRIKTFRDTAIDFIKARPPLRKAALHARDSVATLRYLTAASMPALANPRPRKVTVAITAHCNYRCIGCRYGRDFMPGARLPLRIVKEVIDDAAEAGIAEIRLYGGEPLLHPDLPEMVAHACARGVRPYVTTNGLLLGRQAQALYDAGLRDVTIGFYGTGGAYDAYVQRPGRFAAFEQSIAHTRAVLGDRLGMQLNFLLMRPSCSIEAVDRAWNFAKAHDMAFRTDLVHYSLPYFTEGPDRALQFTPADEAAIRKVTAHLLALKRSDPDRILEPVQSLASIPDWLLKGPAMRVPCDAEKLIWVGADGTVQLCYVTFVLGNLHEKRLSEMLFTPTHRDAARSAYRLDCPNCHCERVSRIIKHLPSRLKYST